MFFFWQGAIRANPFLLKELQALDEKEPNVALERFDSAFFGHVGFVAHTKARAFWLALSGGRFLAVPGDSFQRRSFQHLSRLSAAFAMVSDIALLTLGGSLKRREMLSGRMADALSHLYIGAAVMKRYNDDGQQASDRHLAGWSMAHCLYGAEESLDRFLDNFPYRPVAWALRFMIFPWGRKMDRPDDGTTIRAANLLLEPSECRDRLTAGIHIPVDANEPLALMEEACRESVAMEWAERQVREHVKKHGLKPGIAAVQEAVKAGVITAMEAQRLLRARQLASRVIQVDDFAGGDIGHHGASLENAA